MVWVCTLAQNAIRRSQTRQEYVEPRSLVLTDDADMKAACESYLSTA